MLYFERDHAQVADVQHTLSQQEWPHIIVNTNFRRFNELFIYLYNDKLYIYGVIMYSYIEVI